MAFQDKFRAFQSGLPLGVPACELVGEKVLLLHCAPLELSDALPRWLMLHDELVHNDSPACALRFDELGRVAVTWPVWGRFLDWMSEQIDVGEGQGGSRGASGEAGGASAFALGPGEFRRGVGPGLGTVARAGARKDDRGGAALTWWDGWDAFIFWVKDTLREALHPRETAYDAEHEN